MCGGRDIWELSVLSAQFCCEPTTALKMKSVKKKKKERNKLRGKEETDNAETR